MARFNKPVRLVASLVLCLAASLLIVTPATAQLSSRWQGSYSYPNNNPVVPFNLELQVNGSAFNGRTTEPATFGKGSSPNLYGNVRGNIQGSSVSFVKTYDGTNGVNHSVQYEGSVSADGSTMSGTWRVKDFSGGFRMTALDQASGLPGALRKMDQLVRQLP